MKYGNLVNTNQYGLKQQGQKGGKRGLWPIQITENITGHHPQLKQSSGKRVKYLNYRMDIIRVQRPGQ